MNDQHTTPTALKFSELFVNNSELGLIEAYINRFNPLRVLKIERMEIRHSSVLGWLLTPGENHGLGDSFLKAFLAEAFRSPSADTASFPDPLDVVGADLSAAEVLVEWNHIDIFVRVEVANVDWSIIIENKVDSKQHSDQLERYEKLFPTDIGSLKRTCGVFLTLKEEEPDHASYAKLNYRDVTLILRLSLSRKAENLATEVRQFLNHYLETIEGLCGMNPEEEKMIKLAKKLYRENKKVIDFVYTHGNTTEFGVACDQIMQADDYGLNDEFEISGRTFRFLNSTRNTFWFLPSIWIDALGSLSEQEIKEGYKWDGCQNWLSPYPLSLWLSTQEHDDAKKTKIGIKAEVGPLRDTELRNKLISSLEGASVAAGASKWLKIKFRETAMREGAKYSRFMSHSVAADLTDVDAMVGKIEQVLEAIDPIIEPVGECLRNFSERAFKRPNAR